MAVVKRRQFTFRVKAGSHDEKKDGKIYAAGEEFKSFEELDKKHQFRGKFEKVNAVMSNCEVDDDGNIQRVFTDEEEDALIEAKARQLIREGKVTVEDVEKEDHEYEDDDDVIDDEAIGESNEVVEDEEKPVVNPKPKPTVKKKVSLSLGMKKK